MTIKEQTRVKLLNEVNEGVLTAGEAAGLLGISLRSAPQTPEEIITWLEHAVAAWNEDPTPFTRGGKRKERWDCVRQWELGGSNGIRSPVKHGMTHSWTTTKGVRDEGAAAIRPSPGLT